MTCHAFDFTSVTTEASDLDQVFPSYCWFWQFLLIYRDIIGNCLSGTGWEKTTSSSPFKLETQKSFTQAPCCLLAEETPQWAPRIFIFFFPAKPHLLLLGPDFTCDFFDFVTSGLLCICTLGFRCKIFRSCNYRMGEGENFDGEALVAHISCECHIPGIFQGQAGWGFEPQVLM